MRMGSSYGHGSHDNGHHHPSYDEYAIHDTEPGECTETEGENQQEGGIARVLEYNEKTNNNLQLANADGGWGNFS